MFIMTLIFSLLSFNIFAWEKVTIPEARCGDGSSYFVYLKRGDPRRLSVDFMGGGICWNFFTCWGPFNLAV